jgi:hypothetical protein
MTRLRPAEEALLRVIREATGGVTGTNQSYQEDSAAGGSAGSEAMAAGGAFVF